jgi:FlaG/FlaF family flagellin (archaellin)
VILAAVIGTFVLGLGDSLGDNQPTAQLDVDLDEVDNNITIEHDGGDSIEADSLRVVVEANDTSASGIIGDRLSVGDTITSSNFSGSGTTIGANTDVRIRVIHQPSDSILVDRTVQTTSASNVKLDATDIFA